MRPAKPLFILSLFLSLPFGFACGGASGNKAGNSQNTTANRSTESSNAVKTNVEELAMVIQVPFETEETIWREEANPKRLIAVLKLSPADANKLVAQAESIGTGVPAQLPSESWFPAELIAQSELSGDETLKGTSYAADDFYQPPYTEGKITRIENTDYFVLELTAK